MVCRPRITREQQLNLEQFHAIQATAGQLKSELENKQTTLSALRVELRNAKAKTKTAETKLRETIQASSILVQVVGVATVGVVGRR